MAKINIVCTNCGASNYWMSFKILKNSSVKIICDQCKSSVLLEEVIERKDDK